MNMFQAGVRKWMVAVFSVKTRQSKSERAFRFLEEAVELVQATGMTQEDANRVVAYVYSQPHIGEPEQEVGGVMITLAALCSASDIVLKTAADKELARVWSPEVIDRIRAKRSNRAVPGDYAE